MTERRNTIELRANGKRLIGYAAVFGLPSHDLGGWKEIINPMAFKRTLSESPDVVALWDHDRRSVLGRTQSGTLALSVDSRGLKFEINAPDTSTGRDVLEMVGRGDVTGASFAFTANEERWKEANEGPAIRELLDVDLLDVTITPHPAYPDTNVARRSLANIVQPIFRTYAERELKLIEMSI